MAIWSARRGHERKGRTSAESTARSGEDRRRFRASGINSTRAAITKIAELAVARQLLNQIAAATPSGSHAIVRKLLFVLALSAPLSLHAQNATTCLRALHGSWRGPGTVLGRAIVMEQDWALAVGDAFTQLSMRHFASDSSTRASFQGLGLYRASGDSVRGNWHDSRGIAFAVEGRCTGGTFISSWSGVERGRTVYERRGDSLFVIDSVYPATGAGREFGRSALVRGAGKRESFGDPRRP